MVDDSRRPEFVRTCARAGQPAAQHGRLSGRRQTLAWPCVGSSACRGTEPCLCRCAAPPAGVTHSPQDRRRINKTNELKKRYFKRKDHFAGFHFDWLRVQRSHLSLCTIPASDPEADDEVNFGALSSDLNFARSLEKSKKQLMIPFGCANVGVHSLTPETTLPFALSRGR